jgi:hypothetical protein
MEADLLDDIGDIGVGEHQVLEVPSEAPEMSQISNRRSELGGDLGLCVHRRRNRLVIHHASMLKDNESKLALSEEESICLMLYGDPKR